MVNINKICAYIQEELNRNIYKKSEFETVKEKLKEEAGRKKARLEECKNKIAQYIDKIDEIDEKINELYDILDRQTEKIDENIYEIDEKINDLLTDEQDEREAEKFISGLEEEIKRIETEFAQ